MEADLASLESDRQEYQEQLDLVSSQCKDDPGNAELVALEEELRSAISLIDDSIRDLKPAGAAAVLELEQTSSPPRPGNWSKENKPAFKSSPPEEKELDLPVAYKVNDEVQAKWNSGDRAFYPARITSVTGASSDPIYIVIFKGYGNSETLRSRDIRPLQKPLKRKADAQSAASSAASNSNPASSAATLSPSRPSVPPASAPAPSSSVDESSDGVVLKAAANLYPEKVLEARRAAEQRDEGLAPKRKKIKAKKELEAGKNKWKEFNAKSKFGKHKKDSMFRTPEGIHGRVGFTGSGKAMRKDPTRSRHVYQVGEEE